MQDWVRWHEGYENPSSSLTRRLVVVRRRLDEAISEFKGPAPTILSLCAASGEDVIPVLAERDVEARSVLVELQPELCRRAEAAAASAGVDSIEVRCADAGALASFPDVLPVGVLLLRGIFGNVERRAVHDIVRALPDVVRSDGFVIWTRGGAPGDDPRQQVRDWFIDAGMPEVAFDGPPEKFGVGLNRVGLTAPRQPLPEVLFRFRSDGPPPVDLVDAGPVLLRRQREADAEALVEAMQQSLSELSRWFPWAQGPPDLGEQRQRLAASDRAFAGGADYQFVLVEKDTGELVGTLRLNPQAGPAAAGIGYWVRSDRTGQGYATAATHATVKIAFARLRDIQRIYIHMDKANTASAAIARKLGFELDHEEDRPVDAPDHTGRGYVFVMTRDLWNHQQNP